jgi:hypothetical protein
LVARGVTLQDALKVCVVPYFDSDGGDNSERYQVEQTIIMVCGA